MRVKEKEREYISIRVDKATHARIKERAGNHTLTGFLRILTESWDDSHQDALDARLDDIQAKLDEIADRPPLIDELMIADAVKANPEVTRVGWYNRDASGKWVFDTEAYNKMLLEEDKKREQ